MAQYVDKADLVAELKKRISDYWSDSENTIVKVIIVKEDEK